MIADLTLPAWEAGVIVITMLLVGVTIALLTARDKRNRRLRFGFFVEHQIDQDAKEEGQHAHPRSPS